MRQLSGPVPQKRVLISLRASFAGRADGSAYSSIVQILQSGTYTLGEPQLSNHVPSHSRKV